MENCVAVSKKVKHHLFYDSAIPFLGIFPRSINVYVSHKPCTKIFTATLFIISPKWKQHRCLSAGEWINKWWCNLHKGYYGENKGKKLLIQLLLEKSQDILSSKSSNKRVHTVWFYLCEFWKQAKTPMMIEIRIVMASGGGKRCGLTAKRHKETFCGDGCSISWFGWWMHGCIYLYKFQIYT